MIMAGNNKLIVGLLALSVAANLLAAGIWVGRELSPDRRERFAGPPRVDFSLRELGQYLTDEQRKQVRALLKDHRKVLAVNFMAMRDIEREIRALMVAETVDRDALIAALDKHQAAMDNLHLPVREILLDVVAQLDYETRKKLAENLYRRRLVMGGREGGHDDRRDRLFFDVRPPCPDDDQCPAGPPPPRPDDDDGPEDEPGEGIGY